MEKSLPKHVAIIMDGNGRWAKKRLMPRIAGHKAGVKTLKKITKYSSDVGIKYLTVYAFSSENWNRPVSEVEGIMKLLKITFGKEINELHKNKVKINILGRRENIPKEIFEVLHSAEDKTKSNNGLSLNVAFNYGGRREIIDATKKIALKVSNGQLKLDEISEEVFASELYTKGIPDPDLVIRTSGEIRLSNFLLWQISYSEFYFTDVLWPSFSVEEYKNALSDYSKRKRRYGKI